MIVGFMMLEMIYRDAVVRFYGLIYNCELNNERKL